MLLGGLVLVLAACGSSARTQEGAPARTWSGKAASSSASVPAEEASLLKADVYAALAEANQAAAVGDERRSEAALERAMRGIRVLLQQPGLREDAEVRELYRSTITAYERYHGASDSLATTHEDIFAFREEMFATLNEVEEPLEEAPEASPAAPVVQPTEFTIPLDRNRLVERSIQYLLRTPEKHLYLWLARAGTYFPMIERTLHEEGMPQELKYLAMIESGLNPAAESHVGAGGMWQFMPATGRAYGLDITHWVDERSDPEKATHAAARHLRDLYKTFGDWHLALAAYTCGTGRVRRAVRAFESKNGGKARFWDVYEALPRETRNYVPMFIAATLVASQPQRYGLQAVTPGPRYAYEVAPVEGMVDLRLAAELAGTDVETIRRLNPEIRRGTTPPVRGAYDLRVPEGTAGRFLQAYAALPPAQRRGQAEHVVRHGDTLSKIAGRYGTTVASLQAVNGLRGTLIQVGQRLYVPVPYEGNTAAAVPRRDAEPSPPVRRASTSRAHTEFAPVRTSRAQTRIRYRVRRGDNLTRIAQKYGVSVGQVKSWNGLRSDRIRSGQVLTLYREGTTTPAGGQIYVVRRGDTLGKIARRHGVRISDLQSWNGLHSDRIFTGQRLRVGSGSGGSSGTRWISYTVRRGDTLSKIARQHGAGVTDLRRWNDLRSDRIRVGQRLAIYAP